MAEVNQIIKNARDILVGKVPNPQSQVEQITIAIMYKLMDAKDKEAIDYGGVPSFFTGEYAEYSFAKIINTPNNMEKLTKYRTGLEKMGVNLELPEMFRSVFKGAYLPYNDAAILALFIKEIDKIPTDNTEVLGTAFEDLLSFMGSQGDAGQFRTPRHIIDMIVAIIEPQKNETILDPACGTAGFLVSAFNYIYNYNKNELPGDTLTIDERASLMKNINGYDITPEMVKLAKVNMYLHGFNEPKISEYDTLSDKTNWKQKYDVIFANPPFMTPKGGIKPHELFMVKAKRSEVLFVDYIAEHLNTNGRAGVIVPEGIVFQTANAYKDLRKMIVESKYLYAVISLPAGVFNPYSGVKTSVLLFDRVLAKKTDKVIFIKIDNDGFYLGAQRREVSDNDIPRTVELLSKYKVSLVESCELELTEDEDGFAVIASKEDIAEQDYVLVGERYRTKETYRHQKWPIVELREACDLNPQKNEIKALPYDLEVSFVPMADLNENKMLFSPKQTKHFGDVYNSYTFFKDNDVLLARVTPCFENGKSGIARGLKNSIGFGSSEFFVLRAKEERTLPEYIYYFVSESKFIDSGKNNMTGTGGLQRLTKEFVLSYKIPLPPLSIQEQIVAEIESYQKIVDAARQVAENYKPTIKINSEWRNKPLSDLVEIKTGKIDVNRAVENGKYPFFTCAKQPYYIDEYAFDCEALLLAGNNATADYDVKYYNGKFNAYQRTYVITISDTNVIDYQFLKYVMESKLGVLKKNSIGSQTKYLTLKVIQDLSIPLPKINIQKQIVADINEEVVIINQNKRLIEIFEQKIRDKIADIWGNNECHKALD